MRARLRHALAALICLATVSATHAADVLPDMLPDILPDALQNVFGDFQATYQLRVNSFVIGETQIDLAAQTDGRYIYSSHTRSTGLARIFRNDKVEESSLFKLHKQRIRPLEYRFDHTGSKKERHAYLKFDWTAGKVANTVEGHTWEMQIPEHALDKLVVQLAVMMDLAAGKQELAYAIADGGKLKDYRFAIVGKETLHVPAGKFEALKLERLRKDNDRTTYFWCAPSLGYLPVRIKQIENEDNVTYLSELKRTTLGGQPAAPSPHEK
ncbi:MAG: DUF3108 domain-containing protein [Gammaproteobacteria bacterium]|nr:DUF3108 domain-containing protein [Gammaproteobacteria bacterium]